MAELTHNTKDAAGYVASMHTHLIGALLKHQGNGRTYIITGFAWMGATDEWGFVHHEAGNAFGVTIIRPISHVEGLMADNRARYVQVGRAAGLTF